MRYINLTEVIGSIPTSLLYNLQVIDTSMVFRSDENKEKIASDGNKHWTEFKTHLEKISKRKCWYTESKNPGCLNDLEHYRPKGKSKAELNGHPQYWYWFLAFNPINYRLSSQIPNRLNKNSVFDETGGKGNHFPLLGSVTHAKNIAELRNERPIMLDPCCKEDVKLLAFTPDGRPVCAPLFSNDAIAFNRVEKSKLLLNIDYPTFNEDREELYNKIKELVERGDEYAAEKSKHIKDVKTDLSKLIKYDAEYSKAAECYIRCFRDSEWIEDFIDQYLSNEY